MPRRYWLMKTEPESFSIDDLKKMKKDHWDGIRNYQARNFMRDDMQIGDAVLIYHSNAKPPGIAGLARVVSEAYPDHTAFDEESKYFDPKSDPENPRWMMVDVEFVEKFERYLSLDEIKSDEELTEMPLVQRGQRLSIQPVPSKDFTRVLKKAKAKTRRKDLS